MEVKTFKNIHKMSYKVFRDYLFDDSLFDYIFEGIIERIDLDDEVLYQEDFEKEMILKDFENYLTDYVLSDIFIDYFKCKLVDIYTKHIFVCNNKYGYNKIIISIENEDTNLDIDYSVDYNNGVFTMVFYDTKRYKTFLTKTFVLNKKGEE